MFKAIDTAVEQKRGNQTSRVIACGEEKGPLTEWAAQLAAKFGKDSRNVGVALNNAIRNGHPVYGLTFVLVSGKPYAAPVVRTKKKAPRKAKLAATEATPS